MKIEAIIFDLDGTLCDYKIPVEKALEKAVAQHSTKLWGEKKERFTKENYNRFFKKAAKRRHQTTEFELSTRQEAFKELLEEAGVETDELAELIGNTYTKLRVNSLRLFNEVEGVLNKIASKFKLGLLTNGPSDVQWEKIKKLRLEDRFDQIIVSGDLKVTKPSRIIFNEMLDRLKCRPHEAIYIGDSLEYDVQGANNSGLISVWINRDHQKSKPDQAKPDYEIDDLKKLFCLLKEHRTCIF